MQIGDWFGREPSTYTYAEIGDANPDAVTQIANGVSTSSFAYDNDGNLTSAGTSTFNWDYNNRMTQAVTAGSATSTYSYDYAGNRVSQVVGSTTTVYPNKYYSVTSSASGATTTATTTVYVWNGDTLIATIDQVTVNGVNSGTSSTRYIHPDHLGSTNIVTDESGNIVADTEYYPYGETRLNQTTYPTKENRRFIGQFTDANSLQYLNARYLNSQQGQFLSEDPVFWGDPSQQDLQTPQNLNAYSYAIDNPVNKSDPLGKHVYLVSRPIGDWNGLPTSDFGAHTSVYVVPDNPKTIGTIRNIDTSQPFSLSGLPINGNLMKRVNDPTDLMYGSCGNLCPTSASVSVAPPAGMTSAQFDSAIVGSYNNLPSDMGPYDPFGAPRFGHPNSNNAASAILSGAGVSSSQVYQYRGTLQNTTNRWAPGLGVSATTPTYGAQVQQTLSQLASTLMAISSVLSSMGARK